MLVLTRKRQEEISIGGSVRITVIAVQGSRVRLGIEAPDDVPILRAELCAAEFDFEHRERVLGQTEDR